MECLIMSRFFFFLNCSRNVAAWSIRAGSFTVQVVKLCYMGPFYFQKRKLMLWDFKVYQLLFFSVYCYGGFLLELLYYLYVRPTIKLITD